MCNKAGRIVIAALTMTMLIGCGSDDEPSNASAGGSPESTSTSTTLNPKYDLTHTDWEGEQLTDDEISYQQATRLAFGIGTNPPKMLEYGYDLCEKYETSSKVRADVIRDWSIETDQPISVASQLGAAATLYLCPE